MPFLEISGARLAYDRHGQGRPNWLLVHGGMCDRHDWRRQIEALPGRVVRIDLRGHGQSDGDAADCTIERWAADCNALIDTLGMEPSILVGHSLGTRIVVEMAARRPDNARAVALIDGSRMIGGFAATAPADPETPLPSRASLTDILNTTIGPYADGETRAAILATMSATRPEIGLACVTALEE